MRTVETALYTFDELSEESKEKAIEELHDINMHDSWYEYLYDDALSVGLKITDSNMNPDWAKGSFTESAIDVANAIIVNHGENCGTRILADKFASDYVEIDWDNEDHEEKHSELSEEFRKDLLSEYAELLSKEYDYLTSVESISECIIANGYEFTINGKLA